MSAADELVALDALRAVGIEVQSLDDVRFALLASEKPKPQALMQERRNLRRDLRDYRKVMTAVARRLLELRAVTTLPTRGHWDQWEAARAVLLLSSERITEDLRWHHRPESAPRWERFFMSAEQQFALSDSARVANVPTHAFREILGRLPK